MVASRQQVKLMFRQPAVSVPELPVWDTVLSFDLGGEGELGLSRVVKEPGPTLRLSRASISLPLRRVPGAHPLPPYVRLIHDVLRGERLLFTRPDGLERVGEVAAAVLAEEPEPVIYPKGCGGPAEADRLAAPLGWLLDPSEKTESVQVG
jgi:glucose-6-phosphate 1-dehydrogenase